MNFGRTAILLAAILFAAATDGKASGVILEVRPGSSFHDGMTQVNIDVSNKGDVPAHSVWIEAIGQNSTANSLPGKPLSTDESLHATLLLNHEPVQKGIYTIIIKVHYEDINGFPYTTLSFIPFVSDLPDSPAEALSAEISSAVLNGPQKVGLRISRNPDAPADGNIPVNATVRLVIPDELFCDIPEQTVTATTNAQTLWFDINNISALPGSVYPFFAVIDYTVDNMHRSFTAHGDLAIVSPGPSLANRKNLALLMIIPLFLLYFVQRCKFKPAARITALQEIPYFNACALGILFVFILSFLNPSLLFSDTLTVGGDTAAHCYLASHLGHGLFHHGRIVSWAGGWWCGVPMFQYYFCLPYILIAVLDFFLPFNIAFKLVSVMGLMILPLSAYLAARIMRQKDPLPILMAIAMVPFLFVKSHTMWGVNIYSTLAGMIANSISFPVMILFMASAYRDSDDGVFRFRTVLLLVCMIASHFFTSLVGCAVVLICPFLKPRAGFAASIRVLAMEAVLGIMLMAWWLVPLAAKHEFAVEFGTNWPVPLFEPHAYFPYFRIAALPPFIIFVLPFCIFGCLRGIYLKNNAVIISVFMLGISTALFLFGYDYISPVFVNVRLWPFFLYALLSLAVFGISFLVTMNKGWEWAAAALLVTALVYGIDEPNEVKHWSKWNYSGLERKKLYSVFEELVLPLRNTPGRLANDLHDDNDKFLGSSRVFECTPHVIGKPILEGGIVNSAAGSVFSYYIQSETGNNYAGLPPIVKPGEFNITNATRHLELFNVKHFIARGDETKKALAGSRDWKLIKKSNRWELYELITHDGNYVFIPDYSPCAVITDNRQEYGLRWIYRHETMFQPFVFLKPGEAAQDRFETVMSENGFDNYLENLSSEKALPFVPGPLKPAPDAITSESVTDSTIRFHTSAVGLPHIIKCTYYPNWKVRGADRVYMVSPCFMLVYPNQPEVELYYGYTLPDNAGRLISTLGLVFCGVIAWHSLRCRRKSGKV